MEYLLKWCSEPIGVCNETVVTYFNDLFDCNSGFYAELVDKKEDTNHVNFDLWEDNQDYLDELEGRIDALDDMHKELELKYSLLSSKFDVLKNIVVSLVKTQKPEEEIKPKEKPQNGKGKDSKCPS